MYFLDEKRRMKNCPRLFRTYSHLFCHWAYKSKLIIVEHECNAMQWLSCSKHFESFSSQRFTLYYSTDLFFLLLFLFILWGLGSVTVHPETTQNNSKIDQKTTRKNILKFQKNNITQSIPSASTRYILDIFLSCFFNSSRLVLLIVYSR